MITGAGADRMQTGMAHSFGVSVGRAAMVKEGQELYVFGINTEKAAKLVREEISKIKAKLPCRTRILTEIKK
jgi:ribosomal protein L16/L10AE